jgi:hypothetical protein
MAVYDDMEQEIHTSHTASFEIFLLNYTDILKVHVCLLLIDHNMQLITLYEATL